MRSMVLLLVASGLVLGAPAPRDDAAKDDLKKIQGTWKVESAKRGGEDAPAELTKNLRMTISGEKLTIKDGRHTEEATFKIDPGKKPKAIDIIPPKGKGGDKPVLGIYQLDGDTLKMCWAKEGTKERPTGFASPAKSGIVLMVLKREKK